MYHTLDANSWYAKSFATSNLRIESYGKTQGVRISFTDMALVDQWRWLKIIDPNWDVFVQFSCHSDNVYRFDTFWMS